MYLVAPAYKCKGVALQESYDGTLLRMADMKHNVQRTYAKRQKGRSLPTIHNHADRSRESNRTGAIEETWIGPDKRLWVLWRMNKIGPGYKDMATRLGRWKATQKDEDRVGVSLEWDSLKEGKGTDSRIVRKNIQALSTVDDTPAFSEDGTYVADFDTDRAALVRRVFAASHAPENHGNVAVQPLYVRKSLARELATLFPPPTEEAPAATPTKSAKAETAAAPAPESAKGEAVAAADGEANEPMEVDATEEPPVPAPAVEGNQAAFAADQNTAASGATSVAPTAAPVSVPPAAITTGADDTTATTTTATTTMNSELPTNDGDAMDVEEPTTMPPASSASPQQQEEEADLSKLSRDELLKYLQTIKANTASGQKRTLQEVNSGSGSDNTAQQRDTKMPRTTDAKDVAMLTSEQKPNLEDMATSSGSLAEKLRELQRLQGYTGNPDQFLREIMDQKQSELKQQYTEFNSEFKQMMMEGGYNENQATEMLRSMDGNPELRKQAQIIASAAWRQGTTNPRRAEQQYQQSKQQQVVQPGSTYGNYNHGPSVNDFGRNAQQSTPTFASFGDTNALVQQAMAARRGGAALPPQESQLVQYRSSNVGNAREYAQQKSEQQKEAAAGALPEDIANYMPKMGDKMSVRDMNALTQLDPLYGRMAQHQIGYNQRTNSYTSVPNNSFIHRTVSALLYDRTPDAGKQTSSGAVKGFPSIKDFQTRSVISELATGIDEKQELFTLDRYGNAHAF